MLLHQTPSQSSRPSTRLLDQTTWTQANNPLAGWNGSNLKVCPQSWALSQGRRVSRLIACNMRHRMRREGLRA